MAIITLPSKVHFSKADLELARSGITLRSKYTGKRQTIVHPFAVWTFQGELIDMEGTDAGEWRAFLAQLEGQANTFKLPVPGFSRPTAPTTVVAKAATVVNPRSKSIQVTGPANTAIVSVGDYFTINNELKVVTAAATTNGSGAATISFQPGLRVGLAGGEALELRNPWVLLASRVDNSAAWSLSRPVRHAIKLDAMESF